MEDPSPGYLRSLIIAPPPGYWTVGSGGATLDFETDDGRKLSLLILPNDSIGYYLHYLEEENGRIVNDWLSLWDENRLSEVAPCSDQWMASVGFRRILLLLLSKNSRVLASGARTSDGSGLRNCQTMGIGDSGQIKESGAIIVSH